MSNRLGPMRIDGVREIAGRFRAWFVDVYGVLHDGSSAFPGVVEALIRVREAGGAVIIVTNSAQRVDAVASRLDTAGIGPTAYDGIVSSGELSWGYVQQLKTEGPTLPRLFVLHRSHGPLWLQHVQSRIVQELGQAELMLGVGMPYWTEKEAESSDLIRILEEASGLGLPLLVPDSDELYPQNGVIRLGPGWLARRYRELGGRTIEFGKPYAPIFAVALQLSGAAPGEAIMVGDNLATDITGAARIGLPSLLVLSGVHRALSESALAEAMDRHAAAPSYVAPSFAW